MRRLAPVALLLLLTPGCLTSQLWQWAADEGTEYHKAVALDAVEPFMDGGYTVVLRMSDGSQRHEPWPGEHPRGPYAAYLEACVHLSEDRLDEGLASLDRAVRRGYHGDLAGDPALKKLVDAGRALPGPGSGQPRLVLRDASPTPDVVTSESNVGVVHLAEPEPPEEVLSIEPVGVDVDRGGPLGYTAAALATPVTFALDVATFPVQVAVAIWIIDGFFDWLD